VSRTTRDLAGTGRDLHTVDAPPRRGRGLSRPSRSRRGSWSVGRSLVPRREIIDRQSRRNGALVSANAPSPIPRRGTSPEDWSQVRSQAEFIVRIRVGVGVGVRPRPGTGQDIACRFGWARRRGLFAWVTPLWRTNRASGGCHASCAGGGHDPNEQTPRARSLPADGGRNLFHSPRSRVSRGGPLRHHPEEPATAPMWQAAPRLNPRKQTAAAPDVPSHPPTHTRLGACGEAALRERPPATPPIDAQRSHVQGRRPPESDPPGRFSSPRQAQTDL